MTESNTKTDNRGVAHVVEIDKMVLSNHVGQNVDLRAIFSEFTTTTSIFEPGIRGTVTVYDAHALINRHPIVGQETLHVSFKTPGNSPKESKFSVWKITDEEPDSKGTSSVYTLHFCSSTILQNAQQVVAKSFTNTDDAAAIIRAIAAEYMQMEKSFTTGSLPMKDPAKKLVIPMYRPLEAIDMILRRAYSGDDTKSDYYVFFERYDGWKLYMLDELVSNPINARQRAAGVVSQEQIDTSPDRSVQDLETWYEYASVKYQDDSVEGRDIRRVVGMTLGSRFDTIAKIRDGAFESEVVQYSIAEKSITSKKYSALTDEKRLLGGPPNDSVVNDRGGTGRERTNTVDFLSDFSTPTTGFVGSQASRTFFRLKDPEEKDGVVKKSGLRYAATRTQLSQIQVSITVPGDTMVDVGDVVHLSLPKFESVLDKGERDDFLYGRYIIGAIRDNILPPDKHVMTLDLWRDSYASPVTISKVFNEDSSS